MNVHPTNHPRIIFAWGMLFSEECDSLFDGILVFAEGFTGLNVIAGEAVLRDRIPCPYRFHGVENPREKVPLDRISLTIRGDLDYLSAQGCRRIGIHVPNDIPRAKAALRAAADWLETHPDVVDTLCFVDANDDYYNVFGFESFGRDRGIHNVSPTEFESYYEHEFLLDLQNLFGDIGKEADGYRMCFIGRRSPHDGDLPLFIDVYFSVSLFFTALLPQAVAKVTGHLEDMHDFLRVSGMPLLSRGLGGSMAPYTFLEYAGLLPENESWFNLAREETDYFYRVLIHHIVGGIRKPLSLPARNLSRLDGGQIKAMRQEMKSYIDSLETAVKEGSAMPNYYLPEEVLRQQA